MVLLNKPKDITGKRFGKLVAIKPLKTKDNNGSIHWLCECDCGNIVEASGHRLRNGSKMSCGCLSTKHGMATSKIYNIWGAMKARCLNPNDKAYKNYGSRGITVCSRWSGDNGFKNFLADMGEKPKDKSLDRIDNNKGYSPDNCRWATRKQQQNNIRTNRYITLNGITKAIHEWCEYFGIKYETARRRIDTYGWGVEEALTTPIHSIYHTKKVRA